MSKQAYDRYAEEVAEGHMAYGIRPAGWGYLSDGETGTVVVDAARRLANYWEPAPGGGKRGSWTAILHPEATSVPFEDLQSPDILIPVRLGFMPGENELYIMGLADGPGRASMGGLTPMEQKVNGAYYSSLANVPEFRCEPAGSEVYVVPGRYVQPSTGTLKTWDGGNTALAGTTLATLAAALTSGQHQLVWLTFDLENGVPATVASSAVSATGELPAKGEFQGTAFDITTTYKPLVPINLWKGMPGIVEADFYRDKDARQALMNAGTAGGGGTAISVPRSVLWGGW